jgi:hypothetical protein
MTGEALLVAGALLASFVLCVWIEYRLRSPSLIFWLGLGAFFILPNVYDLLAGHEAYPGETIMRTSLFAFGFNMTYLLARLALLRLSGPYDVFERFQGALGRKLEPFDVGLVAAFVVGCLLWLAALQFYGGGVLTASWTAMLAVPTWLSMPATALTAVAAGCFTILIIRRRYPEAIGLLLLFLFVVVAVKARSLLAPLFLPLALWGLLRTRDLRPKLVALGLVTFFAFSVFALQILRWSAGEEGLAGLRDLQQVRAVAEGYFQQGLSVGEFGRRDTFYRFADEHNAFPGFGEGRTYRRLLLMPIPSGIANMFGEVKPRDFAMDMWNASRDNYEDLGGTDHPTIYGDGYANFGMSGILLGAFWAIAFMLIDLFLLRLRVNVFVASLAPMAGFHSLLARGSVYNSTVILYYSAAMLGAIWLITKLVQAKGALPAPLPEPRQDRA